MENNLIGISGKIGSGKDTVGRIIQYLSSEIPNQKSGVQNINDFLKVAEHINYSQDNSSVKYDIKKFGGKLKQICSLLTGISVGKFEDQNFKDTHLGEEWKHWFVKLERAVHPIDKNNKRISEIFSNRQECLDSWFGGKEPSHNKRISDFEIVSEIPTYRWLLQNIGTEAMRNKIHPNIWINALFADFKPYNEKETLASASGFKLETDLIYPNWIITDVRFPNEVKAIKERGGIIIRIDDSKQIIGNVKDELGLITKGAWRAAQGNFEHPSETALDNYQDFDYIIDNNGTLEELVAKVKTILF